MKKLYAIISLSFVLLTTSGFIYAADNSAAWLTNWEQAKELAAKDNKPILIDFSGSDWCHWCMKLDKEVFSKKVFADYADRNLILFLVDFPAKKEIPAEVRKQNEALAGKYNVSAFPTVLLVDSNGKVFCRTGYRPGGAQDYINYLDAAVKNYRKTFSSEQLNKNDKLL